MNRHNPTPRGGDGFLSNIGIWIFFFIFFICGLLCRKRHGRLLWWRRFRYCRWHVYVEPERDANWYRLALERYNAYRARALELENEGRGPLSKEEEEEVRRLFLLERMAGYTITVGARDIKSIDDDTDQQKAEEDDCGEDSKDADIESPQVDVTEQAAKQPSQAQHVDEKDDHDDETDQIKEVNFSLTRETTSHICLPAAGASLASDGPSRCVSNGCAICLSEFVEDDRVTWASNKECPHVFHEDCLLRWMLSVGRKHSANRSLNLNDDAPDPVAVATNFPMLCPCCRQQFIDVVSNDNNEQDTTQDPPNNPVQESNNGETV